MAKIIPKEQLSAYQRWELSALDEVASEKQPVASHDAAEREAVIDMASALALPTTEDIEHVHQQAYQEGFSGGRQEGLDSGYQEGRRQAEQEAARWQILADSLSESLAHLEDGLADEILRLTLTIAKQVLRQALHVKPESVLPVVKEAIGGLIQNYQHPRVVVHPDDAVLVRAYLAEEGGGHTPWKVSEDADMERGGCRIETANSEIDATLQNRWQRLVAALGQENLWSS